ncbi:hypothetical protein [Inquilinus sp. CAU 1745]|uniref:hypothetical protein n=1 Tax=Inquilinus sp. CAU 1745 TaxID=3140369 RepID=UPI00325B1F69
MGQHHLYGSTAHSAPPPETSTGASDGQAVMLRPDVHLPDWTVVRTDAARHALGATFEAFDMARKWSAMGETEDRVWRTVLDLYARAGKALTLPELAAAVGVAPDAASSSSTPRGTSSGRIRSPTMRPSTASISGPPR